VESANGEGAFMSALAWSRGKGSHGNHDRMAGRCRARFGLCPEEEEGADEWASVVSEAEEVQAYPFGILPGWAVDCFSSWARLVPPAHFSFSDLFFSFSFLFSLLIC
jgi:hypothetical protein